jgi:hypothetical protein
MKGMKKSIKFLSPEHINKKKSKGITEVKLRAFLNSDRDQLQTPTSFTPGTGCVEGRVDDRSVLDMAAKIENQTPSIDIPNPFV